MKPVLKHAHVVYGPLPPKEKLRELIPWEQIGGKPEEKRK